MEGKNLLSEIVICIGAGISQLEYILNLKKMGYKVFCADKDRNAPGFEMANDYIISSTFDFEKTPRLILDKLGQNIKIKGVVAPCTGPPYRTLQIIKQMYGLPYMSKKIVSILLDKVLLRNELNKSGLSKIKIYNDYDEIKPDNFPIVKKPRFEGMGGKGVELFYDYNKYKKIYSNNKIDQKFVYEEFINGTELAVDAIWCNDKIHLINLGYNVFEKDKIIGSTSEVSKSIKRYIPILTRMLTELCKNFKFSNEVINIDAIVDDNKDIHFIEVEFTPADGLFHSKYSGYDFVKQYLRCHLDNSISERVKHNYLSIMFSDDIVKAHTILPDEISYLFLSLNSLSKNSGSHFFYSSNVEKLLTFINVEYPMLSFQRNCYA